MAGATVSTPAGPCAYLFLILHPNPNDLSRAVPVILLNGNRMWAEQDLLDANPRGYRLIRNRQGYTVRAIQIEHIEAHVASHISAHNKGDAYLQPLASGRVWALTGVRA